jgi:hypothetical protein
LFEAALDGQPVAYSITGGYARHARRCVKSAALSMALVRIFQVLPYARKTMLGNLHEDVECSGAYLRLAAREHVLPATLCLFLTLNKSKSQFR